MLRKKFGILKMPMTIVFDTNYLRSLGCSDFLLGRLPTRLTTQVNSAAQRGDLILIPSTVKIEMNAWLKDESAKRHSSLVNAHRTLQESGFKVSPELPSSPQEVDFFEVIRASAKNCDVLAPDINDYLEAERRTSYRLPPHPKNPEHEEMRDRLIWCQLLRYSGTTTNHIVIASADQIFKNGASTEEGLQARISIASSPEDLDQRLGERPVHIQTLINNFLSFSVQLQGHGLDVSEESIESVDQLRNSRMTDGIVEQRFELFLKGRDKPMQCVMSLFGGRPLRLALDNDRIVVQAQEVQMSNIEIVQHLMRERADVALSELRHIIGD